MFSFLLEPVELVGSFSSQDENLWGVVSQALSLLACPEKKRNKKKQKGFFF